MSKCIIHVGMHKTGTSSIQQSLDGYNDNTFYYAGLGSSPNHSLPIYSLFSPSPETHHLHRQSARNSSELKNYIQAARADLKRSIVASEGKTMIVSGEGIALLRENELIKLKNHLHAHFEQIRIVAYVRAPAAYINSAFQQRVKGGLGSIGNQKLYRNYKGSFAKFDEVFGQENVHLSKFNPKAFANECVVTDFCLRLGINLPEAEIRRTNESLSLQAVRLLYTYNKFCGHFNAGPMYSPQAMRFVKRLEIAGETKFRFSSKILNPILEVNRDDIAWMEQRMGDTLEENSPNHQPGDVRDESDLLHIDNEVLTSLVKLTGGSAAKNLTGKNPEQVAQLLHALRQKMGLNNETSNDTRKPPSNAPILNRARVGRAEPKIIVGWAIGSQFDQPVEVVLSVNGREVMHATADYMRKDIRDKGLHPTGRCGFEFKLEDKDGLSASDEIIIRFSANEIPDCEVSLEFSKSSSATQKREAPKVPESRPGHLNLSQNKTNEIILHVGHGKTGSSYLQSALAISTKELEKAGIAYPEHPSFHDARQGFISSGNAASQDGWVQYLAHKVAKSKQERILFSYEGFFEQILAHHKIFATTFEKFKVNIILFIRDPMDHMISSYCQGIKRGRQVHSADEAACKYNMVRRVNKFIDVCQMMGFELIVINYTKRKRDLSTAFEEALGIPAKTLNLPKNKTVNRSLTKSEMELQRLFNLYYKGNSAFFISDILCNQLPEIASEAATLSPEIATTFIKRLSEDVENANKKLDTNCAYSLPLNYTPCDQISAEMYSFSKEQIEVLVRSICAKLGGGDS